jgi:hypothetical protein
MTWDARRERWTMLILRARQISRKIVDAWHAEHPGVIIERGSTKSVDFDFPTGELISFDGTHWHHRRR